MSSDYAFLDEIWGPLPSNPENPACQALSGKLDNIMDAYISSSGSNISNNNDPHQTQQSRAPLYDIDAVEGYNAGNPLYAQSFGFEKFYADELKNVIVPENKMAKKPSDNVVQEEYTVYPRDQIYKDIVEKYASNALNKNTAIDNSMLELVAFICGGIFLIFFLEQILQIGGKL